MTWQSITNSLETNEKIENFSKEMEFIERSQMKITELKNTVSDIKKQTNQPQNLIGWTP